MIFNHFNEISDGFFISKKLKHFMFKLLQLNYVRINDKKT